MYISSCCDRCCIRFICWTTFKHFRKYGPHAGLRDDFIQILSVSKQGVDCIRFICCTTFKHFRKYRSHAGLREDYIQVLPVSKLEHRDVEKDQELALTNHGVHHIETLVWFMVFNATFNNISVIS